MLLLPMLPTSRSTSVLVSFSALKNAGITVDLLLCTGDVAPAEIDQPMVKIEYIPVTNKSKAAKMCR
jgi:hypothetical protein